MAFTFAGACAYGALMGYINSSQQLFQDVYGLGDAYALWFGLSAAFISAATFLNARLVASIRMETICITAMAVLVLWSLAFEIYFHTTDHVPELLVWMVFNCVNLFLLGLTFGNFNAIALKSFGHIAGIAAALIASVNSALSIGIAWMIGNAFDGTNSAMMLGYLSCGAAAVVAILIFDR
jgi:DHA1 family bicyclomycin/chloramphenicol resistance-like MFS transporter